MKTNPTATRSPRISANVAGKQVAAADSQRGFDAQDTLNDKISQNQDDLIRRVAVLETGVFDLARALEVLIENLYGININSSSNAITNLGSIESDIASLSSQLVDVTTQGNAEKNDLNTIKTNLNSIRSDMIKVGEILGYLFGDIGNIGANLKELTIQESKKTETLKNSVNTAISGTVSSVNTAISGSVNSVNSSISSLNTNVNSVKTGVNNSVTDLGNLRTSSGDGILSAGTILAGIIDNASDIVALGEAVTKLKSLVDQHADTWNSAYETGTDFSSFGSDYFNTSANVGLDRRTNIVSAYSIADAFYSTPFFRGNATFNMDYTGSYQVEVAGSASTISNGDMVLFKPSGSSDKLPNEIKYGEPFWVYNKSNNGSNARFLLKKYPDSASDDRSQKFFPVDHAHTGWFGNTAPYYTDATDFGLDALITAGGAGFLGYYWDIRMNCHDIDAGDTSTNGNHYNTSTDFGVSNTRTGQLALPQTLHELKNPPHNSAGKIVTYGGVQYYRWQIQVKPKIDPGTKFDSSSIGFSTYNGSSGGYGGSYPAMVWFHAYSPGAIVPQHYNDSQLANRDTNSGNTNNIFQNGSGGSAYLMHNEYNIFAGRSSGNNTNNYWNNWYLYPINLYWKVSDPMMGQLGNNHNLNSLSDQDILAYSGSYYYRGGAAPEFFHTMHTSPGGQQSKARYGFSSNASFHSNGDGFVQGSGFPPNSYGSVYWMTKYHTGSSSKDLWRTFKWTCPRFERERVKLSNTGTGTIQCFEVTLSDINTSSVTITNAGSASASSGSSSSASVAAIDNSAVRRGQISLGVAGSWTGNRIELSAVYEGAGSSANSGTSTQYLDLIANGDLVFLLKDGSGSTMPGGLSENTPYYVVGRTTSGLKSGNVVGFSFSASKGGNAITVSNTGSSGTLHIFEATPRQVSGATSGTGTVSDGNGSVAAPSTSITAVSTSAFSNLTQTVASSSGISLTTPSENKNEIVKRVKATKNTVTLDDLLAAVDKGSAEGYTSLKNQGFI